METRSLDLVRFGPYEVRPATRELFKHGMRVKLPPQAFEVLRVLLERKGELVSRQEFHRILWSADTFVDFDQGLNNAIKRIREVLNDSSESPRYIETLPRLGYRFIGGVDLPPDLVNGAPVNEQVSPSVSTAPAEPEILSTPQTKAVPVARKRPIQFAVVAAAVVVALVVGWLFRPYYPKPRITNAVQITADGIPKWGPLATDGLRVYFNEVLNGRQTIAAVPTTGGQAVPLNLSFPQACLHDLSPDKTDLLVGEGPSRLQDAPLWRIPVIGGTPRRLGNIRARDARWSNDGKKLAYVIGGGVYLANADGSESRLLVPPESNPDVWAWQPVFSPDNRRIRFDRYDMQTNAGHLWEVNADGSSPHLVFRESADWPMQAFGDWTPDGSYSLFSAWRSLEYSIPIPASDLWAVREKAGVFYRASERPEQLTIGPTRYTFLTFHPDGKTVFALSSHKHGELMRYDARTEGFSPYASGSSTTALSFSRDGKWVAYSKYPQGELWRSRIDGSEPLQLSSHPLFADTPAWSPDGRQIAFNGALPGQRTHSYLVSADGGEPRMIDAIGEGGDPRFTPDGNFIAFMDVDHDNGGLEMLNLKTGVVTPIPGSKTLMAPRISPDGRWIAAVSQNVQKLLLFDVRKQSWRELAHADRGILWWVDWSHDSSYLYFERSDPERQIVRIRLQGGTPEVMVELKDYPTTGPSPTWFALTPKDEILVLHDVGTSGEIYALSWDAP